MAPLSVRYFSVGTAARMRVSSVMFCSLSRGTLRSARTNTCSKTAKQPLRPAVAPAKLPRTGNSNAHPSALCPTTRAPAAWCPASPHLLALQVCLLQVTHALLGCHHDQVAPGGLECTACTRSAGGHAAADSHGESHGDRMRGWGAAGAKR